MSVVAGPADSIVDLLIGNLQNVYGKSWPGGCSWLEYIFRGLRKILQVFGNLHYANAGDMCRSGLCCGLGPCWRNTYYSVGYVYFKE